MHKVFKKLKLHINVWHIFECPQPLSNIVQNKHMEIHFMKAFATVLPNKQYSYFHNCKTTIFLQVWDTNT